jgi:hypothetical protein
MLVDPQIDLSQKILILFLADRDWGLCPVVDHPQIVAQATLSALAHHWPSRCTEQMLRLLDSTQDIKNVELSRWATQRRIAIAKIHKVLEAQSEGSCASSQSFVPLESGNKILQA